MANRGTDFRKRLLETDVLILGAGGAGRRRGCRSWRPRACGVQGSPEHKMRFGKKQK